MTILHYFSEKCHVLTRKDTNFGAFKVGLVQVYI